MKEKSVTLNFIVNEYIRLYGVKRWSVSIYGYYTAMYDHYVKDTIGKKNINVIKARTIDEFYKELLSTPAVRPTKNKPTVTPSTIQKIHKFLKAAVEKGIGWELCDRNPFRYATLPKFKGETRECWTAEEFLKPVHYVEMIICFLQCILPLRRL